MKKNLWVIFSGLLLASCGSSEEIKYEQYLVNGEQHYLKHCSNCHQADGSGLKDLYPPLAGSDFLNNKELVICLIRNGMSGEIKVNGKSYNQPMPANKQLYELDIAELTTYIYDKWGNSKEITEVSSVKKTLGECKTKE
jgi:mono/diheme cytochrome c family protein